MAALSWSPVMSLTLTPSICNADVLGAGAAAGAAVSAGFAAVGAAVGAAAIAAVASTVAAAVGASAGGAAGAEGAPAPPQPIAIRLRARRPVQEVCAFMGRAR